MAKVLWVDDDLGDFSYVQSLLASLEYDVKPAHSVCAAYEILS